MCEFYQLVTQAFLGPSGNNLWLFGGLTNLKFGPKLLKNDFDQHSLRRNASEWDKKWHSEGQIPVLGKLTNIKTVFLLRWQLSSTFFLFFKTTFDVWWNGIYSHLFTSPSLSPLLIISCLNIKYKLVLNFYIKLNVELFKIKGFNQTCQNKYIGLK